MTSKLLLCGFGLMVTAGVALAQDAPAPPVEKKTVTSVKADPISCVHSDAPTGSRMGATKVCHTRSEWQTIHANAQYDMQRLSDHADIGGQLAAQASVGGH